MVTASALAAIKVSAGNVPGAAFERREQVPVLDVVGRRPASPISEASKQTSGARSSRAVSSTMRMRRSGAACSRATLPDAQRLERRDRTREQRGGAVVVRHRRPGDHGRLEARAGKRDRRGQARRTAADHRNFGYRMIHGLSVTDLTFGVASHASNSS